MIGNKIGRRLDPYLGNLIDLFPLKYGSPAFFTLMGLLSAIIASCLLIKGSWIWAGLIIILSGLFDLLDGVAARKSGKVTVFGGFLDSVLDRYSDIFLLLGLIIYYLKNEFPGLVILTFVVSIGTVLIPYVRAKAESLQIQCTIGLMERAERIILLAIGALFHRMEPVLWILAVLTHFTVLHRIYSVWKKISASRT